MRRCEPTMIEEEEAQLELALQASSFGVQKANVPPFEQTGKEQIATKPAPNSVNQLNVNYDDPEGSQFSCDFHTV